MSLSPLQTSKKCLFHQQQYSFLLLSAPQNTSITHILLIQKAISLTNTNIHTIHLTIHQPIATYPIHPVRVERVTIYIPATKTEN